MYCYCTAVMMMQALWESDTAEQAVDALIKVAQESVHVWEREERGREAGASSVITTQYKSEGWG
jgi:hypothetical protein